MKYVLKVPVNQRFGFLHENWVSSVDHIDFTVRLQQSFFPCSDLEKAAEAAFQDRNLSGLDQVLAKCSHRQELSEKVQMLRSQLGAK